MGGKGDDVQVVTSKRSHPKVIIAQQCQDGTCREVG